ncbi:MAG: PDDEXK nuclease domain-containing protein, partial [Acetatifactor sp.]|nr:PDDEXK nuclease domain-containing protein [Acetatifactor sp.]
TNALRSQLTWTHYRLLLSVENEQARQWYMNEAIASAWSSRQSERQISTLYYERLLASRDQTLVKDEAMEITAPLAAENFIKAPYVLEFLNLKNYPALRESDLEQALIDKLQEFLLELGRGFCFAARQKLMRYEDEDFYLDLVFYHSILKCHVLIDLKVGKLTHGDIGQMDSYIRMFDALYKNEDDNPTIGIILCSQKNEAIVKYSVLNDAQQIFASRYRIAFSDECKYNDQELPLTSAVPNLVRRILQILNVRRIDAPGFVRPLCVPVQITHCYYIPPLLYILICIEMQIFRCENEEIMKIPK